MKSVFLIMLSGFSILFFQSCNSKSNAPVVLTQTPIPVIPEGAGESEGQDGIAESQKLEFEVTRDVSLGYVPKHRLIQALEKLKADRLTETNNAEALGWTERGSNTDIVGPSNGNGRVSAGQVTSGRLRTIWVDLADVTNQTVWVGGIDGGIWTTTNITADPATWTLSTDLSANIAVSSICQSPANTNIMYFGTGEKTINIDAVRGGGVWKSTDHGVTWNLLPSTVNFWNVSNVICDPTNPLIVYVATIGNGIGIQRSIDGGTTWTTITPTGLSDRVTRMEISSTGRMHVVCGYRLGSGGADPAAGYRYTDIPSTVTSGAGWITPVTSFYTSSEMNADIAVAGNTLYALPSTTAFQTPNVWKSTDGGANWATVTAIPIVAPTPVSSGQAWYNLAIGTDPTNANNVMVGGLNSYISTDGGTSWTPNSVWVTGVPGSGNYIHADHHIIVWNNNQVLDGGDGGIFYSGDDGVTFSDRNVGLRLKQFYSVAVHPTSTNYFIGGTQDNGTHQLNGAGLTSSVEVTGGDGAFCHIDQDEPQFQFGAFTFSQYRRSQDGGATWSSINFSGSIGQFINPSDYDDINNKFYASWSGGQYFRWDNANSSTTAFSVGVTAFNGASVRHVNVSPHTVNRVFFGTGGTNGARIVRVDDAHLSTPTGTNITGTGMPASPNSVSCVAVGTTDNNLLATFSNYGLATNRVWVSTTGGGAAGWTNITGNLPDIPVRWAMFFPEDNTKALLGSDLGVWETSLINGGSTVWVQDPTFPKVRVDMLQYRRADGLVVAATHGRGIWTAPIPLTTPYVRFAFNYNTKTETTTSTIGCRNYTDYTVDMRIDIAPTGNANVTLSGTGSALQGVDYDFTTNGNFAVPSSVLTFASGSTTPQPVTIRIYNDAEVETSKSFALSYSIGGGTNAVAAPSSPSYTFLIGDNDVAPTVSTYSGNFSVGANNTTLTLQTPFRSNLQKFRIQYLFTAAELTAAGITGAGNITSMNIRVATKNSTQPYNGFTIALGNTAATNLSTGFVTAAFTQVYSNSYSSVAGDNTFAFATPFAWDGVSNVVVNFCFDNAPAGAEALSDLMEGTLSPLGVAATTYSNSVVGAGCSLPAAFISNVRITATFGAASGNPIASVLNTNQSEYLTNNGTYYFIKFPEIIGSITNASANLGCVNSNIFESGTTWVNFLGGERSQKVFDIVPTTNPGATYTVGLYFTNAELDGETPNGLRIAKTTAATMAGANSSNTVIATTANPVAFGSGWLYTATFTGFSKFFLVDLGAVLPVSLLSFNGQLDNDKIPLNWVTASEQNSKHFDLEKSVDGINFYSIGIIPAAGNSSSDRKYDFTDYQVKEFNYYRLKMIDIDEKFVYSQVILIKNLNLLQGVQVINNPFSTYIDIRFTKIPTRPVQLELLNMTGAKVYSRQFGAASQIRFDLPGVNISSGTYLLRVIADGKQYVSKVVKQ